MAVKPGHVRRDAPLPEQAWAVLRRMVSGGALPAREMSIAVREKLLRAGYINTFDGPSPYRTHTGLKQVLHVSATLKGFEAVHQKDAGDLP